MCGCKEEKRAAEGEMQYIPERDMPSKFLYIIRPTVPTMCH